MTRSLSNLYKQWFVQTDSTNTRIIDSNVILQQHLKQDLPQTQTPAQNVQEEEGGFSAGLVTGDPGQVIKAEPQIDYEAKAKAKAEAENFSCCVFTRVLPATISPVLRLNLRICDGDTYTSFSPGR